MFETMYCHNGVGLAAPQIGVMKQVAVIDVTAGQDPAKRIVMINPRVTATEGMQQDDEGCLCLPGFREDVTRALRVVVDAREATGGPVRLQGEGLLSRALQHETDHLNGVLFIQRLSALKCDLIRRRIRKMLKAGEWGAAISAPRSPAPARWKVGGP
jgi:peptide deformylase